jgi:hypothetical protein
LEVDAVIQALRMRMTAFFKAVIPGCLNRARGEAGFAYLVLLRFNGHG